jgi:hypothetical protein
MASEPTEKIRNRARKNKAVAILLGLFLPPLAYVYVDKWTWAIVNFVTLNYLLLGIIIVPIHSTLSIGAARDEVGGVEAG